MKTEQKWLPSPEAARFLGISVFTLKRYGHPEKGFLIPGLHWRAGAYPNSPIRWDVEACRSVIDQRGMQAIADANPSLQLPVVISR